MRRVEENEKRGRRIGEEKENGGEKEQEWGKSMEDRNKEMTMRIIGTK